MAALVLVAFGIFERPVGHFVDAAALVVAIAVAVAVAAALAALAFVAFLSTRRRRARAGGCVSCTLRCQHAMTEGPRRLLLISITDRTPVAPSSVPASSAPASGPAAAGVRAVVPAGRSLPVVSINGRPSLSSSHAHAAPVRPSPGRPRLAGRPSAGHPELVRPPAGPDDPRWPDRPARRVPERVGS
ncbi:MAG: hypothetical protein ACRDPY_37275 [Streptosporangiaceae bacterium]